MTGRYGFRTGWYNLIGREATPSDHLDPREITFGHMLKRAGYATGLSGKWQLGSIRDEPNMIVENGFDTYCAWAWASLPVGAKFQGSPRQRYWHPALIENGKHRPTEASDYGPDIQNDWIIDFIKKNRDRPFLAYYPMCLVHKPWDPTPDPDKPGGKTEGGLAANIEYMDKLVGKVVAVLEDLGLRDQTLIFFTGDNGTDEGGKGTVTEPGVRVPMIASGPGVQKGHISDALIDFSDVLPTLAELTGTKLPEKVAIDGHSFAPMLHGEKGKPRDWIFSFLASDRMIRDSRWLLEGDGRLYDCGDSRDGTGYRDVTGSLNPQVVAARQRLESILKNLPAPPRLPRKASSRPAQKDPRRR
jgi:arylsulfatase A